MENTLREIVSRIAEIPLDFDGNAHMRDELNIDSFRAFEIVFEVERSFSIKVPENRYRDVQSFNDIVSLVRSIKGE
jgi:acyl carrier protein